MNLTINGWVNEVHSMARAKGWWENPRDEEEIAMLFVTELAEASECARAGEPAIWQLAPDGSNRVLPGEPAWDPSRKPEGEAVEIADLLIRLADWAGHKGWDWGQVARDSYKNCPTDSTLNDLVAGIKLDLKNVLEGSTKIERPLTAHFQIVRDIVEAVDSSDRIASGRYFNVVESAVTYMILRGWDVEKTIEMKMAYNSKRAYRHGGKLA